MNPDIEQLLGAILADVDNIQRATTRLEDAVIELADGIEATRVSLGALRAAVREATT